VEKEQRRNRPGFGFRGDLSGDVKFLAGVCQDNLVYELFAAAVAVDPRSVAKIATEIDGALLRIERSAVFGGRRAPISPMR